MYLEHAAGEIELRLGQKSLDMSLSRSALTSRAGQLVVVGDGGWDPATLTLGVRITSPSTATPGDGALAALDALVAAAKTATCLREAGDPLMARTTYLAGLVSATRRLRPLWWEVELRLLPRALDGVRGTGETVTHQGAVVSHNGLPVTVEVH